MVVLRVVMMPTTRYNQAQPLQLASPTRAPTTRLPCSRHQHFWGVPWLSASFSSPSLALPSFPREASTLIIQALAPQRLQLSTTENMGRKANGFGRCFSSASDELTCCSPLTKGQRRNPASSSALQSTTAFSCQGKQGGCL